MCGRFSKAAAGGETRPPDTLQGRQVQEKGGYVMINITLNDYISLTLMLIALATLVIKLCDSRQH
jgi:hypothetical protein